MRKFIFLSLIFAMIIISCQTKTKVNPVDIEAAKASVTKVLDAYNEAFKAKDAGALMSLLTEDGLYCGTDSRELLNKADLSQMMTESFTDTSLILNYTIDSREILIDKDGNSAVALEQMFMKPFSQKIPVRMVYHLVKNDESWLFDFISWSFIPNNEDIAKLNAALDL